LKTYEQEEEKGIPEFWLKAIDNSKTFGMINENDKDKEILKHLEDVILELNENKQDLKVHFVFGPNEYFKHNELVIEYKYNEDEELKEVIGSNIEWSSDEKNPTKKLVKKKPKKAKGKKVADAPVISSWEDVESFFSIFASCNPNELDKMGLAKQDAEFFREDLVPNAMEYYLDIMGVDDEFDEEGEECEDDECDDDHGKKASKPVKDKQPKAPGKPEEGGDDKKCKNQ